MKQIKFSPDTVTIPANFGNGSNVNHVTYGKGKCVGFVGGTSWRIQFESGKVLDFLPSKLFSNLVG